MKSFFFLTLLLVGHASLSQSYVPGNTYWDSTGYVEYRAGNLPLIISAPHGGNWSPDSIPDRNCSGCRYIIDAYTRVLSWGLYNAIHQQTGCYPHLIMNRLHREKFDANRDIGDAADGNPYVERAWRGYHAFIDSARASVMAQYQRGLFLDIHGHGHAQQRIELGYLLTSQQLSQSDSLLNAPGTLLSSAIRRLAGDNYQQFTHAELLKGAFSFGTLMHKKGYPSVPSTADPFPGTNEPYFTGGYNTKRHGSSQNNGPIDAIQIELNQDIRFQSGARDTLIDSLSRAMLQYIDYHYLKSFLGQYCRGTFSTTSHRSSAHKFSVYPNPASHYFKVNHGEGAYEITVHNYLGQKVASGHSSDKKIRIEHLRNGYYKVLFKKRGQILAGTSLFINNQ